jgi:hypothetical protein
MSSTRALLILDKARRNGWTSVEIERALGLGRGRITRLLRGGAVRHRKKRGLILSLWILPPQCEY